MKTKKYEYILFDWDGCLGHSLNQWITSYKGALKELSIETTDSKLIELGLYDFNNITEYYNVKDVEEFGEMIRRIFHSTLPSIELYPGAYNALLNLKRHKKKIALVTSSSRDLIDFQIERHKIQSLFDVTLAWEDTENNKPHPEPLEKALHLLQGNKETALMIGDSSADLLAAKAAGVDSAWFYPAINEDYFSPEGFLKHEPTYILKSFDDLLSIIDP